MYNIIAFLGPSASGKTTLQKHLGFDKIVTYTTRLPREGEENGVAYHFTDKNTIIDMYEQGLLLEYTEYYGYYYGTDIKSIERTIIENKVASIVVDVHGAKVLKEKFLSNILIIGVDSTYEECRERLAERDDYNNDLRLKIYNEEHEGLTLWSDLIINNNMANWKKAFEIVDLIKLSKQKTEV